MPSFNRSRRKKKPDDSQTDVVEMATCGRYRKVDSGEENREKGEESQSVYMYMYIVYIHVQLYTSHTVDCK